MSRLNDLLAALAAEGADAEALIAEYIAATEDLPAALDEALDAFAARYDDEDQEHEYTDADVAELGHVTQILEAVRAAYGEQQAAAAERSARAAELAARALPPAPEDEPEAGAAGDGTEEEEEPEGEEDGDSEGGAEDGTAPEPVPVTAATPRNSALPPLPTGGGDARRLARRKTPASPWSVTAAADISGIPAGGTLADDEAITDAVTRRLTSLSRLGRGAKSQVGIASLKLTRDPALVASADGTEEQHRKLVDHVADERRLAGGSLTAASGNVWCSPSTTVYDLCPDLATNEGLVDVPSFTVSRGGVRYPQSPDYDEVYAKLQEGVWEWDPNKSDNAPKPCLVLPCPDFDECRLTPIGLCIQTDILTNHSWPELVKDWYQRLLTAREHLVNNYVLSKMAAGATKVVFAGKAPDPKATAAGEPFQPGATSTFLSALALQAQYLRESARMSKTATIEIILPTWVREMLRSDLSKRPGVDLISVADARIESYFTDRHLRVQWVYDWAGMKTDAAPTAWPGTVQALMYPAGTYALARQDVIQLDGIYDSTQLAHNVFTGLFAEEAVCLIQRCNKALNISIDVCPDGATSLPVAYTCPVI